MTTFAADTWGISGPRFLTFYAVAAGLVFLAALTARFLTGRGEAPSLLARDPGPGDVAYLADGPGRAVFSSVAALRAAGVVDGADQGRITVTGPAPAGASDLDRAVHVALGRGIRPVALAQHSTVTRVLDAIRAKLVDNGMLYSDAQRRRMRWGVYALLALTVVGAVRILAGMANDRPVGFLMLATAVTLVLGLVLFWVPRVTRRGTRWLAGLRSSHAHLAPGQAPSWALYGAAGAGLGVALYGTTALWTADPAFAEDAGIAWTAGTRNSDYFGGSAATGASCGGGSSSSCGGGGSTAAAAAGAAAAAAAADDR